MPAAQETGNEASSRKGIAFSILAVALAALGAWFWSTYTTGLGVSAGGNGQVKGTLHLETFVLNLADPEQRCYLRVGIDLGLSREIGKGENAPPVGQVRDTILGVLAQSRVDDLLTAKGKVKLKEDLLHALQERVPGLGVEEVYFTEFLIQR
jgi:flagellar basal body-associated protein FliL